MLVRDDTSPRAQSSLLADSTSYPLSSGNDDFRQQRGTEQDLLAPPEAMESVSAEILPETSSMWGAWVLDVARSDTFDDFLECLGAPEAEAQAHAAGEQMYLSRNVIALDRIRLVIHKDTAVNRYSESFVLDQEQVSEAPGGGMRRTVASLGDRGGLDGYVIATTTTGSPPTRNCETVEVRQIIDGGSGHIQQIELRNLVTGAECVMRRYWVRVPLTPEDQMRLLAG